MAFSETSSSVKNRVVGYIHSKLGNEDNESQRLLGTATEQRGQARTSQYGQTETSAPYVRAPTMDGDTTKQPVRLQSQGWTPRFTVIVLVNYLIIQGFIFSLGCLNAPSQLIEDFMNETEFARTGEPMSESQTNNLFGLLVAVVGLGAAVASVTSDALADRLGKVRSLAVATSTGGVGVLIMALCRVGNSYEMLFVGRVLVGLGIGWGFTIAPSHVMEICHPDMRGAAGVANQLSQSFFLLVAQVMGFEELLGNEEYWPLLIGVPLIQVVVQLVCLPFMPESPRYLLLKKDDEMAARKAFRKLHGVKDVEEYMQDLYQEQMESATESQVSILGLFKSRLLRRPLMIAIAMGLQQNWCGMNAILFFSNDLFNDAGITGKQARYATAGTGLVFFLGNIGASFLLPRFGRKTLFVGGTAGIALCCAILPFTMLYKDDIDDLKYVNIIVSLALIACYALGPICVFWVILGELFPHSARGAGFSIIVFGAFVGFFTHGLALPYMRNAMDSYVFFVFTAIDIAMVIFCMVFMPETRNKTFAEVAYSWATLEDLQQEAKSKSIEASTRSLQPTDKADQCVNGTTL